MSDTTSKPKPKSRYTYSEVFLGITFTGYGSTPGAAISDCRDAITMYTQGIY
jgi:hypothetical protein